MAEVEFATRQSRAIGELRLHISKITAEHDIAEQPHETDEIRTLNQKPALFYYCEVWVGTGLLEFDRKRRIKMKNGLFIAILVMPLIADQVSAVSLSLTFFNPDYS